MSLGFKSLQNDFFYVNQATIDTYRIEPEFVLPILVLADMDANAYLQSVNAEQFLVNCDEPESALKGTGVLRYIRTMAAKSANQKKQSDKPQTIREVLEKQGGTHWYAPKATPAQANIWLRKAFGDVYSPFIFSDPVLVDQRCNKIEPLAGVDWTTLSSYMTSSVFSLSLEVNGAAGLGGGALEIATRKLSELPIPDMTKWSTVDQETLRTLAGAVWNHTTPRAWRSSEAVPPELMALDEFVLKQVGAITAASRMHAELRETSGSRYVLADDKKRGLKQKTSADIGSVARSIAESVQPLLDSRRFPEDFLDRTEGAVTVRVPEAKSLRITFLPLLDHAEVKITGNDEANGFEFTGPTEIANIIRHAVLLGRREFDITSDRNEAHSALNSFFPWVTAIHERISAGIQSSALGTGYENALTERVFELLRMDPAAGSANPPSDITINATLSR